MAPRAGIFLALTVAFGVTQAHADDLWSVRTDGPRPVLVHRDTADPRVDDRLRLACEGGGRLSGEIPLRRIQDQGPVAVVRVVVGTLSVSAPTRRREDERGAVLRFRIDDGKALLAALYGANEVKIAILRFTYALPVPDRRPIASFVAACGALT